MGWGRAGDAPLTTSSGENPYFVESGGAWFGVHDDPNATEPLRHPPREIEDVPEQCASDALALRIAVHGETCEPEHGHRVGGELLLQCGWQCLDLDRSGRHGCVAEDAACGVIERDVGGPDVMPELVLTGILDEEAVEVDVAALEAAAVVRWLKDPNRRCHG